MHQLIDKKNKLVIYLLLLVILSTVTNKPLESKNINSILSNRIKDYTSGIFLMKREVLNTVVPIATGHGEFMVEFLYNAEKKGNSILEIPYVHPVDIEGNSKSFPNLPKFLLLGFFYLLRLFQTIFRR